MRIRKMMLLFGGIVILLTACQGVEPENRAFPLVFSMDFESGEYRVIYGIPDLSQVTGQGKKAVTESEHQDVRVYTGASLGKIQEEFGKSQQNYLDLGHVKALLLGKGIRTNQEALEKALAELEVNPAIAGNIRVFACENIEAVMAQNGSTIDSLGEYLIGIVENKPVPDRNAQVELQTLYNAWHNEEVFPMYPQVRVQENQIFLEYKE